MFIQAEGIRGCWLFIFIFLQYVGDGDGIFFKCRQMPFHFVYCLFGGGGGVLFVCLFVFLGF